MDESPETVATLSRRRWLQLTAGGSAGLALGGVIDVAAVRAATKDVKLANVTEMSTSCNFCSCGCGMIASVREGKLVSLEGDFDHVVNRGSLCAKGLSMFPTHASPLRNQVPRYRAPGSDNWVDISWEDAIDRIAKKLSKTRDEWSEIFLGTDACVSPVLTWAEAPNNEHIAARGSLIELDGVTQHAPAPRFSRTPAGAPTPPAGEATDIESIWT